MKNIILFVLFCSVCASVKHSFTLFLTASTGIPDFPQFMGFLEIDGIQQGSCNSNNNLQIKTNAGRSLLNNDPKHRDELTRQCFEVMPRQTAERLQSFKLIFNQSAGVHVLQAIQGCELDENTGEVEGFLRYGYDGDDFLSLDLKNKMWIALKPQAALIKQMWDTDEVIIPVYKIALTQIYLQWLKVYLSYVNITTTQTVPPSVSLLQKSPSSPVSCHATGFYPNRVEMFWRKDGEEIHEDVDPGEILPNHDGTFQMRVDLDVSSVKDEDWSRYDCVFQMSGVDNDIIRLTKADIRTNLVSSSAVPVVALIGVFVGLLLLAVGIAGLILWKKKEYRLANTSD